MDFQTLRQNIVGRVTPRTYASMLRYLIDQSPKLWGLEKPDNFVEATMCYTIYMDLHRMGANRVENKFGRSLGFKLGHKAVLHNSGVVRKVLARWGDAHTDTGNATRWTREARTVAKPQSLQVCAK